MIQIPIQIIKKHITEEAREYVHSETTGERLSYTQVPPDRMGITVKWSEEHLSFRPEFSFFIGESQHTADVGLKYISLGNASFPAHKRASDLAKELGILTPSKMEDIIDGISAREAALERRRHREFQELCESGD